MADIHCNRVRAGVPPADLGSIVADLRHIHAAASVARRAVRELDMDPDAEIVIRENVENIIWGAIERLESGVDPEAVALDLRSSYSVAMVTCKAISEADADPDVETVLGVHVAGPLYGQIERLEMIIASGREPPAEGAAHE